MSRPTSGKRVPKHYFRHHEQERFIKLGIGVGSLRITSIVTVHPYHDGAASSIEMKEHALAALPALRQGEGTTIRTYGVLVEVVVESGNAGRFVLNGYPTLLYTGTS